MRWKYKDLEQWHNWFAWHPVRIYDRNQSKYVWVWLEHIERKGLYLGYGEWSFNYRNAMV